ncbi:MAG: SUMF1/EgtB/PvdO family nonheme iron enzyme [Anaerolineaceae bacterium]|nr:SUMF1/EgtB/PvdO family nonheme iron enzyme [Anaerolineaceae bacterium]
MLLTQMAVLHQRDTELPNRRVELYKKIVDLLLRRWQNYREIPTKISDELKSYLNEGKIIHRAMEHLAFLTHRLGKSNRVAADLPRRLTIDVLEEDEYLGSAGLAEEFLNYLDQRSGLLHGCGGRMSKPDSYAFPHRTFQEYLAGCYLNRQKKVSKLRLLMEIAGEGDFWDIVFKMAIEERYHIGNDPDLAELSFQLNDQCELETERGQRLVYWSALLGELLGVKTIQDYDDESLGITKGQEYLQEIRERVITLFSGNLPPLERVETGNALAALGDPRFQKDFFYLPDDEMLGFVEIPEGKFLMGSDPVKDIIARKDEQPQHKLHLPMYYIAKYPVTVGQWQKYVKALGHQAGDEDGLVGIINHPVMNVTWHETLEYCEWLNAEIKTSDQTPQQIKKLIENGWQIGLPSEAEWEKAARGENGKIYPYGNQFDSQRGNTFETGIGTTSSVGCFVNGDSPFECLDMSGNVWEWTRSVYSQTLTYPYELNDTKRRENLKSTGYRVLRGGSFDYSLSGARCACRGWYDTHYRFDYFGFRICLRLNQEDD